MFEYFGGQNLFDPLYISLHLPGYNMNTSLSYYMFHQTNNKRRLDIDLYQSSCVNIRSVRLRTHQVLGITI